jgi:hypothetical protein
MEQIQVVSHKFFCNLKVFMEMGIEIEPTGCYNILAG